MGLDKGGNYGPAGKHEVKLPKQWFVRGVDVEREHRHEREQTLHHEPDCNLVT